MATERRIRTCRNLGTVALLSGALHWAACAPLKDGDGGPRKDAAPHSRPQVTWDWNWKNVRDYIRAVHEPKELPPNFPGIEPKELDKIWRNFRDSVFFRPKEAGSTTIGIDEFRATILAFDADGNGRISSAELEGMEESPVLKWLPPGPEGRSCGELSDLIWRESSLASTAAINELARAICWLDSRQFGGDGNFLVSRQELGSGGWFNSVWKASFGLAAALKDGKGSAPPKGSSEKWNWIWPRPRYVPWLERLLSQQAFGRYARWESASLKDPDRRLEWIALSLRGYIARHVTKADTSTEGVIQNQLSPALKALDLPPEGISREARLWYDLPWARTSGKPNNKELDWKEAFYLFVDAEFIKKFTGDESTGGDFRLARWDGVRSRDAYWAALFRSTRRIRASWGLNTGNGNDPGRREVQRDFWDTFQSFDRLDHRGDGSGRLEIGEALLAWNSARVVDSWLEKYDVNRSGVLEPTEAEAFTRALKKEQPELLKDNPFTEAEALSDVFSWFRYISGNSHEVPASVFTLDIYVWLTRSLPLVR